MEMPWDDDGDQYSVPEREPAEKTGGRIQSVIRISGSGTLSDVTAKELVISGTGKVTGPVNVEDMHVSGSGKIAGPINCSSKLDVSGALKVESDVQAEEVLCSGSIKMRYCKCNSFILTGSAEIDEKLEADVVQDSGTLRAMAINAREMKFSGVIRSDSIEGDNIQIHGALNSKRVKAQTFKMESMGWGSDIGLIDAGDVMITVRKRLIFPGPRVTVDEIRGNVVQIDGVSCRSITAQSVKVGDNCNIGYIEAASMSISGKSTVGEKRTLEGEIEK